MSTAQKGRSDLRLASLRRDRELVRLAREAAFEIVDADPTLAGQRRTPRRARPPPHRRGHRVPHPQLTHPSVAATGVSERRIPPLALGSGSSARRRPRGRGPSGRGSPRSGRRRCRRAATARRRPSSGSSPGCGQQVGPPAAVDARDHGVGSSTGSECPCSKMPGDARQPPDPDRLAADGRAGRDRLRAARRPPCRSRATARCSCRTLAITIGAGQRAGLQGSASYAGAPTTGIVMAGTGVARVEASNVAAFAPGDLVVGADRMAGLRRAAGARRPLVRCRRRPRAAPRRCSASTD